MTLSANRISALQSAPQRAESRFVQVQDPLNRAQVEHFIRRHFHRRYGALINDFRPQSIALIDPWQQLTAAFDYQSAATQTLALESFLARPVEQVIADKAGIQPPARQVIVEAGHLAADCDASVRRLVLSLASHFHQQGYRWLLMTATPKLLHCLRLLGVGNAIYTLAKAEATTTGSGRFSWGSYFEQGPGIYAIDIDLALNTLARNPMLARLISRGQAPEPDHRITLYQRESSR